MLINATRPAEVRAAILENGKLDQLEIETQDAQLIKGNVYLGRIANVEASLNACFVEFGADKQGFLPVDEIHPSCFHKKSKKDGKPRIEEVMQKGREILVQVVKDAIGNKGAALTSRISLAGRYIVLMPLDDVRGVSRKISNDSQRKKIKELAGALKVPKDYGFIVRTAGLDRTKTDLNRDAAQLVRAWKEIDKNSKKAKAPQLLYEDRDLVVRMLRDYYASDIKQVVIDTADAFTKAADYFGVVMPRSKGVLTHYVNRVPLFTRYQVEQQVEQIFGRRADLKSGGYILIDPTEALISIDVNSGRSTKQKSQEETALHTNLEAAREVARQLRLRDLGGLIVIDFIDMPSKSSNRKVEKVLKDALKQDKARTYVSKISENGLCEVNRQRLKQALTLRTHRDCPTCDGRGIIPSQEFVGHKLLRSLEAKAANGTFYKVVVEMHPELADHVQNTHRRDIMAIENRFGVLIFIEGRPGVHRGEQDLEYFGLGSLSDSEKRLVEGLRESMPTEDEQPLVVRASAPPPVDGTELDELSDNERNGEDEGDEEKPKRKRRRRRRKRKSEEGEGSEEGTSNEDGEVGDSTSEGETAAEGEEGEEGEKRPRRRRRRRGRGRGRSSEESEGSEDSEGESSESTEEGESSDGEESSEDGEEGEASRSQKRRRRRRRGRGRGRRPEGEDGEESGEPSSERPSFPNTDDEDTDEYPPIAAVAEGEAPPVNEDDEEEVSVEITDEEAEVEEAEVEEDWSSPTVQLGEEEVDTTVETLAAPIPAVEEPAARAPQRRTAAPEADAPTPGMSLVAPPSGGLFGDTEAPEPQDA